MCLSPHVSSAVLLNNTTFPQSLTFVSIIIHSLRDKVTLMI